MPYNGAIAFNLNKPHINLPSGHGYSSVLVALAVQEHAPFNNGAEKSLVSTDTKIGTINIRMGKKQC